MKNRFKLVVVSNLFLVTGKGITTDVVILISAETYEEVIKEMKLDMENLKKIS